MTTKFPVIILYATAVAMFARNGTETSAVNCITASNTQYAMVSSPCAGKNFHTSSELLKNINKINSFASLPDNWDGYGAKSFNGKFLNTVIDILKGLSVQPEVFPTGRDSIQIEYEPSDNKYLEFEIYENGRISMYQEINDDDIEEELQVEEIESKVREFYARI